MSLCNIQQSRINLSLLYVTYAHVHVFVPGVSWNRITILAYRMLYMLSTIPEMTARLHVRQQKNHATTLPNPLHKNLYPTMTYMTPLYVNLLSSILHDQHNKFIRWRLIPTYVLTTTELSMPIPTLPHMSLTYIPQSTLAALLISSHKRNILTC